MGTDALPIVIEFGKEKERERELDFLPGDTVIALVLSSLKFVSLLPYRF